MPEPQPLVLNVNDDEANRYMVTRILECAGFAVVEASDGRDALAHARRQPSLIVLDIKLPDISGLEVCRRLKADPSTRNIPVLQTSATFVSSERKVEGLDSGADGYLAQPIEPPELVATVRSLLRTQRAERELQDASQDWQRTFDAIADAVAIVDRDGAVVRCNLAMTRLAVRPNRSSDSRCRRSAWATPSTRRRSSPASPSSGSARRRIWPWTTAATASSPTRSSPTTTVSSASSS